MTQDYPRVVGTVNNYMKREKVYVFSKGRTCTDDEDVTLESKTLTYRNVAIENGDVIG